jgi:ring-1,2-phenylacetyl-CoA epoxidase subunit PaaC
MLRQYFMDVYHQHLYKELSNSKDERLAGIAAKSLKEVTYHVERSDLWIKRMALGTEESFNRLQASLDKLWHYHHELFEENTELTELINQGIAADPKVLKHNWLSDVNKLLAQTPLEVPKKGWKATGGRKGHHSEYLGLMLCEIQFLQRAYPNCEW